MDTKPFIKALLVFVTVIFFSTAHAQHFFWTLNTDSQKKSYKLFSKSTSKFGFAETTADESVKWEIPIDGRPHGMAWYKGNIVVVYSNPRQFTAPRDRVWLMLIDVKKQAVKENIAIYKHRGMKRLDITLNFSSKDDFCNVLILKLGKADETEEAHLVSLKDNFVPETAELTSKLQGTEHISARAISCDKIYFCYYKDGKLTTAQYDVSGQELAQLTTDFNFTRQTKYVSVSHLDSMKPNDFNLSISYPKKRDRFNTLYKFDFSQNKVLKTEPLNLNKEYFRSIESAYPDIKKADFVPIDLLNPTQIICAGDKMILVKEIQASTLVGNTSSYFRAGAIVSVYTNDLKLIKEFPIGKRSKNNLYGFDAIFGKVNGDKLYLITNESSGLGFTTWLHRVSLNDYKITSEKIPDPRKGANVLTIPSNTEWYDDYLMVPFIHSKLFTNAKMNTDWVKVKY